MTQENKKPQRQQMPPQRPGSRPPGGPGQAGQRQRGPGGPGRRGPGRGGPGGHMGMMPGEKAQDFKGTMAKLINYLSKYKVALILVMIIAVGSTVAGIVGPKILGQATTELFEGAMAKLAGTGDIDFDAIRNILLTVLGLYVASALLSYAQGWIMAHISNNITYRLRRDIAQKINRMPLKFFDTTTHGEVLSRITNDVDTVNQTLSQGLTQIITSVVTVVGVLVMMFSINWLMTLVSLLVLPMSMVVVRLIVGRSQKYFVQQQEFLGHVNGHIEEMYGGHTVMKAFNGEEKSVETFDSFNTPLYNSAWKSQFFSSLMQPIIMFIGNVGYVLVTIIGGYLVTRGSISVGDIQAFIQYVRRFTRPLTQLANISNVLQQTAAAAERVFEFLEEEEEVEETADAVELDKVEGNVEFKNVNFGYLDDQTIIHDFSAEAEPGKKIAIVGPTGAGKTTMVKLLMRFYDVNDGAILVDGHDLRDFTRNGLRDKFAMVLQDTWLYSDTIMENIRYGRQEASDEEVMSAAKTAHVDHFIHTLTEGYGTVLNEEASNISQGQKQLLTIARAILADPEVLILDEATSSVDTRTEVLIQRAMDTLMEGRTSFVIAHRLSTIRDADLILVMNDGDIVEQGTHDQLLEAEGFYAELYNSQFEPATAA